MCLTFKLLWKWEMGLYYPLKQSMQCLHQYHIKKFYFSYFISRSRNVKDKVLALHYAMHARVCTCVCACVRVYVHSTYDIQLTMLAAGQTIQPCMTSVPNELGKDVECCGCGSFLISVTVLSPACRDWRKSHKTLGTVASVQATTRTRYFLHTRQNCYCLRQSAQYFTKCMGVLDYYSLFEPEILHAICLTSCYGQRDLKFPQWLLLWIPVFWDVALCGCMSGSWCFEGSVCFNAWGQTVQEKFFFLDCLKTKETKILLNAGNQEHNDIASQPVIL
jgi:hypothetical protein